jgi:hypothetical protein
MRSCPVEELYDHIAPKQLIYANIFYDYEDDISHIFHSESEVVFTINLYKTIQNKVPPFQDSNVLFLSKILRLLLKTPINTQK